MDAAVVRSRTSGVPARRPSPRGFESWRCFNNHPGLLFGFVAAGISGVQICPGATRFTRTPLPPNNWAGLTEKLAIVALVAAYGASVGEPCRSSPTNCRSPMIQTAPSCLSERCRRRGGFGNGRTVRLHPDREAWPETVSVPRIHPTARYPRGLLDRGDIHIVDSALCPPVS